MKRRSTTPVSTSFTAKATLVAVAVLMAGAGIVPLASQVLARDFDSAIQAARNEANAYNAEASRLGKMADTLQGELDKLNAQADQIRAQIAESQRKIDELNQQIKDNEALIERNRQALGQILSDIYVDDQISPLEMLASSKNIGDFMDKQEQRGSLRTSLKDKIDDIKALQKTLEETKASVENVMRDQEMQRKDLAGKQAEQAKLVNDTKNDQNAYSKLASERNAEVTRLQAEQAAAIAAALAASRPGGSATGVPPASGSAGGYPAVWANAPLNAYVDNWGLYSRQCVSYAAWKVYSTGRYVPHFAGAGNANQWPSTTARYGIPSGKTPRAGSVAMWPIGYYGHVMYVESVNGDGSLTVSDYNLAWDGLYRIYTISGADAAARNFTYIYF